MADAPALPPPGPADICETCGLDRPLFVLCGDGHDHLHACRECLAAALRPDPDQPCPHWYARTGLRCARTGPHGTEHHADGQSWTELSPYDQTGPMPQDG